MHRLALAVTAALVVACGARIKSYNYMELPPLPADQEVAVFADVLPTCPYDQVGLIASDDMKDTLERARQMGADGVIGTPQAESDTGGAKAAVCGTPRCVTFNTVAIRFTDPTCRE